MKKMLLLIAITCGLSVVRAQDLSEAITVLFDKYSGTEGVMTVNISGELLKMVSASEQKKSADPITDMAAQVKKVRMLVMENNPSPGNAVKTILGDLPSDFESLMSVRENDIQVEILIRSSNEIVSNLILIADGADELVVLEVLGAIRLDQLSEVLSEVSGSAAGAAALESAGEAVNWKMTPNPAPAGASVKLEIPEEMFGGEVFIYDLNGSRLSAMQLKKQEIIIPANALKQGVYLVNLEKDGLRYGKKLIVQ